MMENSLGTGKNLSEVQRMNRSLILGLLEKSDVCSRAELAKKSGLQQATITNIISDFIDWGVVIETGIITGKKGRRSIGITLNASRYHVVGLRLTRKYFQVGLFTIKGDICHSERVDIFKGEKARDVLGRMLQATHRFLDRYQAENILAIGVSVPGPFMTQTGTMYATIDFPGWSDICLREEFEKEFSIPVIVDHDAKAGALAEWWISDDTGNKSSIVYMALGQGLGAGILNNGRVLYGRHGIAGEIGHMMFPGSVSATDCLTNYASTTGFLTAMYRRQINGELDDFPSKFKLPELLDAVRNKHPVAMEEYQRLIENYSVALTNVIWCYNPDMIILGDEMTALGETLVNDLICAVSKRIPAVFLEGLEIKLTSFHEDPAFIGTAALVIEYAIQNPEVFQ